MATFDRDRLTALFPALEWGSPTVVRCTEETRGAGTYIKASGGRRRWGQVSIVCSPAFALSVRLEHRWPHDVSPTERSALDEALLAGIMQGLTSEEYPAWLCAVDAVKVGYVPEQTTRQAVNAAAAMAIQDALRSPAWKLQTWPPGAAPHGDEPA
ncbi:MAG TPA: hypothetical protein VMT87_05195 [Vicinamibacteria bacterium]|nr:hypothetical protein [Vicinamibacteria bacterium]